MLKEYFYLRYLILKVKKLRDLYKDKPNSDLADFIEKLGVSYE